MDLRSGSYSEDRPSDDDDEVVEPRPTEMRWRVSPAGTVLKVLGVAALLTATAFNLDQPVTAGLTVLGALIGGGYALRDLVAPVRLAADPAGLTVVTGFAGQRRFSWDQIDRVRVDRHNRAIVRSQLLEIDTGETLHLLSTYDLNASVDEVADDLERIRNG